MSFEHVRRLLRSRLAFRLPSPRRNDSLLETRRSVASRIDRSHDDPATQFFCDSDSQPYPALSNVNTQSRHISRHGSQSFQTNHHEQRRTQRPPQRDSAPQQRIVQHSTRHQHHHLRQTCRCRHRFDRPASANTDTITSPEWTKADKTGEEAGCSGCRSVSERHRCGNISSPS